MKNKYSILIRWSVEDDCYIATSEEWNGLSTFGDTRKEALIEAENILVSFIKISKEDGEELPKPNIIK